MLIRTHLAVSILAIVLMLSYVTNKTIFIAVFLIATFIPDIDTAYSRLGKHKIFRPLQFFVEHRGIIHSFTFLILATIAFAFTYPIAALPFFAGYSLHLIADSFTIEGIKPFYPWSRTISGKIKTGGKTEFILFVILVIMIIFLIIFKYTNIF
jgi:inner membrane protein